MTRSAAYVHHLLPAAALSFMGVTSALVFANLGAAYGTAKSGVGIASMGVARRRKWRFHWEKYGDFLRDWTHLKYGEDGYLHDFAKKIGIDLWCMVIYDT